MTSSTSPGLIWRLEQIFHLSTFCEGVLGSRTVPKGYKLCLLEMHHWKENTFSNVYVVNKYALKYAFKYEALCGLKHLHRFMWKWYRLDLWRNAYAASRGWSIYPYLWEMCSPCFVFLEMSENIALSSNLLQLLRVCTSSVCTNYVVNQEVNQRLWSFQVALGFQLSKATNGCSLLPWPKKIKNKLSGERPSDREGRESFIVMDSSSF